MSPAPTTLEAGDLWRDKQDLFQQLCQSFHFVPSSFAGGISAGSKLSNSNESVFLYLIYETIQSFHKWVTLKILIFISSFSHEIEFSNMRQLSHIWDVSYKIKIGKRPQLGKVAGYCQTHYRLSQSGPCAGACPFLGRAFQRCGYRSYGNAVFLDTSWGPPKPSEPKGDH
jgi:hypothetical protein